ncbi:MAG TPA: site-specific integrase [Acidimicrobiia bacterium]
MKKPERGVKKDKTRGTWYFTADAPGNDGKRHQHKERGFESMDDANDAVVAYRAQRKAGHVPVPSDDSVAAFAAAWIAALPAEAIEPATVKHYHECLNRLLPTIGAVRLQELAALDLDRAYAVLLDQGRCARTVRASHVGARKMLKEAVRVGKVARNVTDDARPPRAKAARAKQFKCWTYPETLTFLAAIESDRDHACYSLVAFTGLRQGEVVALRWDAVDLAGGTLTVERSVGKGMAGTYDKQPKSDAGRRAIELDPELVALLRAHRKEQAARRLLIGSGWRDNGLVFCEVDGSPIRPERLAKRWSDLVRRHAPDLGLPAVRFHDLRHGHATALLAAGVRPDVVSERLGHASVGFTLSTYAHRSEGDQRAALTRLRQLL